MNGWVRWHRASRLLHGKDPSWVIKYTRSALQAPGPSQRHYSERGIGDEMRQNKVLKSFSVSSRWDVVLTTNMTPPRVDWMCTRAYGVEHAGRVASPLAKRVLGLQSALSAHADDGQWGISVSPWFCLQTAVESKEQKARAAWSGVLFFPQ